MSARVSGRRKMNAVPLPGVLSTVRLPRRARTESRTTSRPTPRPDSSLTLSRVEKPGSKIRLTTRGSSGEVPVGISPRAMPLRTIFSRSSPRPSSSTRIATRSPSWPATSVIRPIRGFLPLEPFLGRLERVIDGVADQMDHGIAQPLDDRPVQPRFLADDPQLDLLARSVGQIANHPGEPGEELIDRNHPQLESRVADLPAHPLQRLERVQPRGKARVFAQSLKIIGQDDQLTGQANQVIKLQGVDPDAGMGSRGSQRRQPGAIGGRARPPGGPTAAGVFVPLSREDGAGIETAGVSDGSAGVGRVLVGG